MSRYRRAQVPGATYFFTVNLRNRRSDILVRHVDLLRETVRATRERHPFHIDAWVVLPDHMHCVWTLPEGDADFALRWKVIKFAFAKRLPKTELLTATQRSRGERGIWQRRYWEHLIHDERDYRHHVDYVHLNPLKHGWVTRVADWPYSSFHRAVAVCEKGDRFIFQPYPPIFHPSLIRTVRMRAAPKGTPMRLAGRESISNSPRQCPSQVL